MISCNAGQMKVSGTKSLLMAELCTLLYGLRIEGILTKEDLEECFKDSFIDEDHLQKLIEDLLGGETQSLLDKMIKELREEYKED